MRQPKTDIPGLVLKGNVAFLPADIDRLYSRNNLPDHAALLANLVRWAAKDQIPLQVEGRGLFDCNLYTQPGRVIAHVVNLTATGRMPVTDDDLVRGGAAEIRCAVARRRAWAKRKNAGGKQGCNAVAPAAGLMS